MKKKRSSPSSLIQETPIFIHPVEDLPQLSGIGQTDGRTDTSLNGWLNARKLNCADQQVSDTLTLASGHERAVAISTPNPTKNKRSLHQLKAQHSTTAKKYHLETRWKLVPMHINSTPTAAEPLEELFVHLDIGLHLLWIIEIFWQSEIWARATPSKPLTKASAFPTRLG